MQAAWASSRQSFSLM